MSDISQFELPEASEKLPFKFILDSLKERTVNKIFLETPPSETQDIVSSDTESQTIDIVEMADSPQEDPSLSFQQLPLPVGKKYFRIGEVSDLIGVEPYVLRYWESEFESVRPVKSGRGHRVYSLRDVQILHYIRHLLHKEKFNVQGARKKLSEWKRQQAQKVHAPDRQALKTIAHDLRALIQMARANPGL